jgi:hypothetical protein
MRTYVRADRSRYDEIDAAQWEDDASFLAHGFVSASDPNDPYAQPILANIDMTTARRAFRLWGGWDAGYMAFRATFKKPRRNVIP